MKSRRFLVLEVAFGFLVSSALVVTLTSSVGKTATHRSASPTKVALASDISPYPPPIATPSCLTDSSEPAPPPRGLVDLQVYSPGQTLFPAGVFVKNSPISGVQLYVDWSDLEPTLNQMDLATIQAIDNVFCRADAHKKFVVLTLVPGFATPPWQMQYFPHQYFGLTYGSGLGGYLPLPWDTTYLGRWTAVVTWMAARYAGNAELSMVSADGPTSVSEEMSLPHQATGDTNLKPNHLKDPTSDLDKWISLGYTPALYEGAWSYVFTTFAEHFKRQYVSLSLFQGLPINDRKVDPGESSLTLQSVLTEGKQDVGTSRFVFQGDGLTAANDSANSALVRIQECTIAAIGFQTQGPERKIVNSVATLQAALSHGVSEGASFIELYNSLIHSSTSDGAYRAALDHAARQLTAANDARYGVGGSCISPKV